MDSSIQMPPPDTSDTTPDQGLSGDDAVLTALFEEHGIVDDESPISGNKVGEDAAEPADGDDDEETSEEQADEASTEEQGEPEATDVQEIPASLKAALKLDGLPDDLIDLMVKTDRDKAIAYALGRQRTQRDVNQAFQERAELQKAAEADTGTETDAGVTPAQPSLVNLETLAQPLIEELGEDAAGAVVKMVEAALKPAQERMQALEGAQADLQGQREEAALSSARRGLEERFPQVKDATAYAKLVERAKKMGPAYADREGSLDAVVLELLTDASILEFGQGDAPAKPSRKQSRSQMTSPNRNTPPKSKSKDDQETEILQDLERKYGYG